MRWAEFEGYVVTSNNVLVPPCDARTQHNTSTSASARLAAGIERQRKREMMGLHLGKMVGSPRLLSPAFAAENKHRGFTSVEQVLVLPATTGAIGDSRHPSTSHPRRQFASAAIGTHANVTRKRGVERIGARSSFGPLPPCVAVQVAQQQGSARNRIHTAVHTQRRLLSSRDGFGGGQHFPHSDQVRQSLDVTYLQPSFNVHVRPASEPNSCSAQTLQVQSSSSYFACMPCRQQQRFLSKLQLQVGRKLCVGTDEVCAHGKMKLRNWTAVGFAAQGYVGHDPSRV